MLGGGKGAGGEDEADVEGFRDKEDCMDKSEPLMYKHGEIVEDKGVDHECLAVNQDSSVGN